MKSKDKNKSLEKKIKKSKKVKQKNKLNDIKEYHNNYMKKIKPSSYETRNCATPPNLPEDED